MRLIDADKLNEDVLYWNMHDDPKQKDYDTRDIEDVLREQPTVEAIPVEWLKENAQEYFAKDEIGHLDTMITDWLNVWRAENENP